MNGLHDLAFLCEHHMGFRATPLSLHIATGPSSHTEHQARCSNSSSRIVPAPMERPGGYTPQVNGDSFKRPRYLTVIAESSQERPPKALDVKVCVADKYRMRISENVETIVSDTEEYGA